MGIKESKVIRDIELYSLKWHRDFIDQCLYDLKHFNKCYCYYRDDIKELKELTGIPFEVTDDDGTYTLEIPFVYQEGAWSRIASFIHNSCNLTYQEIRDNYGISFSYYSKVSTNKIRPTDKFIDKLVNMIIELGEVKGNLLIINGCELPITNKEVERIELARIKKSPQERELLNRQSPRGAISESGL